MVYSEPPAPTARPVSVTIAASAVTGTIENRLTIISTESKTLIGFLIFFITFPPLL